jgi:3D-(3,5/4)-trihydroxycyclohexane-1,2-dione acylhydrolase (decyclizing)
MATTVRLTMAQALVRFLAAQRVLDDAGREVPLVRGVFGIFGHGNVNGIGQALEEGRELEFVQGKSEQGMVHAAVAYARQLRRRRLWACTTSVGPGALNMATAAATATVNRIPVLLLPGDVFASRRPDPVLQQIEDPSSLSVSANDALRPVSVYWDRICRPEQLMAAARAAIDVLTDPARMGAVTLALPQDVQTEAYDYPEAFFAPRLWRVEPTPPPPGAVVEAVAAIAEARRPLLVVGGGARYAAAGAVVDRFCRAHAVPFAETQAGKSTLAWDHPWNVGAVGVTGTAAANALARDADVVIGVGTRWGDFTTASKTAFAADARFVNLNVRRADAARMGGVPVVGDATLALEAIDAALTARGYRSAHAPAAIERLRGDWEAEVARQYAAEAGDGGAAMAQTRALGVLEAELGPDDVIVNAAGSLPGDLHRLWRSAGVDTYHLEYGFSCMGYEVAGALGVQLAQPERQAFALVGDGSFLMLHSELFTAVQLGVKIVVVVFNNGGYQSILSLQRDSGSPGFANEFRAGAADAGGPYLPIDFAAIGRALGAIGLYARTPGELASALAEARRAERSVVIDVAIAPGSQTRGYDSWWDVPVAEVTGRAQVAAAAARRRARLEAARPD